MNTLELIGLISGNNISIQWFESSLWPHEYWLRVHDKRNNEVYLEDHDNTPEDKARALKEAIEEIVK